MANLDTLVPNLVLDNLNSNEKKYLQEIFDRFGGYPNLEQLWALMDEPWVELGCDPLNFDARVASYYKHPVWMLNGIFIEQHVESLEHRRKFTQWIVDQKPQRIADFGGGFGGLARIVGQALPNLKVEVVDPYPHPAAIALAHNTPNVRFVPELSGEYDILIATDVFEHVPDPVGLTAETADHLRIGGQYLIANCFEPVMLCHLPQLYHFNISWETLMQAMGFKLGETVAYGRAYSRQGKINVSAGVGIAECSRKIYSFFSWLPRGRVHAGRIFMSIFCR